MNSGAEIAAWGALAVAGGLTIAGWRLLALARQLRREIAGLSGKCLALASNAATQDDLVGCRQAWEARFAGEQERTTAVERARLEAETRRQEVFVARLQMVEGQLAELRAAESRRQQVLAPVAWPSWITPELQSELAPSGWAAALSIALLAFPPPLSADEATAADWLQAVSRAIIVGLGKAGASPVEAALAAEETLAKLRPQWPPGASLLRLRGCFPGMPFDADWMALAADASGPSTVVEACLALGVDRVQPGTAPLPLRKAIVSAH